MGLSWPSHFWSPTYVPDAHPFAYSRARVTRRSRIIALQGAVVGVLLIVVYLTILRPTDDNSVSGVNAPGPTPQIAATPPHARHHQKPPREHGNRPHHKPPQRHGSAPAGGRVASATGAAAAPGATPSAPGGGSAPTSPPGGQNTTSPSPGGNSPTDDQYNDTLARLNAALR